ncbi:class I SAM-dependent methyltransferase [Arsenicicoccus sp. oral taxon 190]|uniref:class I SAM-dependent methyltransferase n=1 Tax=Arsenicicoccus sp. oral taxon 190 TaxID=1658671 RepID=UPI000679F02A|nr:class I SAM-dependent methyltransferase [Arsenicicoccus sp. oral taxon 190]AKT51580.1 methyltransferase [Arsenicicoccus sp. oral taxon 190]
MEGHEVCKLARLEDAHWWYRERRHILGRLISGMTPGRALDIGAAGGGNTRVLLDAGWQAVALEYTQDGALAAADRRVPVMRADATELPLESGSLDLVMAFDLLEHLVDDDACVREAHRLLKPGAPFLVAVPVDPKLWSDHDVAVGHVRRYLRPELLDLLRRNGFDIERRFAWNVLLRPVVALRRRTSQGSDLQDTHWAVNAALRSIITAERYLPIKDLPGVTEFVVARRR